MAPRTPGRMYPEGTFRRAQEAARQPARSVDYGDWLSGPAPSTSAPLALPEGGEVSRMIAEQDARTAKRQRDARENPRESTVAARCQRVAERRGWRMVRRGVGVVKDDHGRILFTFGERGEADYEVFPGKDERGRARASVFVELKRPGEKPKPHQAAWLAKREAEGHVAGWCDNERDFEALVERGCQ